MQLNSKFKIQNSGDEIPNSNFKIPAHILGLATLVFFFLPLLVNAATLRTPPNNLGLVGYWSMEDGSGTTATDFSGNGNDGTLNGDPQWVSGKRGTALDFDGNGDCVNTGSDHPFGNEDFSVSFWVENNVDGEFSPIAYGDGDSDIWWRLRFDDYDSGGVNNDFRLSFDDGNTKRSITVNDVPILDNNYDFFTIVHTEGDNYEVFVDGESKGTTGDAGSLLDGGNNDLYLGCRVDSQYFNGKIDEVRVYNRALSASEVKDLYQSGYSQVNTSRQLENIGGLQGWWTFDGSDMTTNVADASGNGNDGKLSHSGSGTSTVIGRIGQALEFDGSDDYVDGGSNVWNTDADFSVTSWLRLSSANEFKTIVDERNGSYVGAVFEINNSGGTLHTSIYDGSNEVGFTGTTDLRDGEWHHGALVWDESETRARLYVDGIEENTGANSNLGNTEVDSQLGIGVQSGGSGGLNTNSALWPGTLDDVRLYDRALSAEEIERIYDATRPSTANASRNNRLTDGLVGMWSFDGPDMVTNVADVSGNGNDGKLNGQTSTSSTIGKIGQALSFDGSDDYVHVGTGVWDSTGPVTLSFWNYADSSQSNGFGGRGNDRHDDRLQTHAPLSDGNIYWDYGDWEGSGRVSADYSSYEDEWTLVTLVSEGASGSYQAIYLNGEEVASSTTSDGPSGAIDFDIGRFREADGVLHHHEGKIDDVRLYDRVLSAEEVKQLYRLGQ